ncbi:MAG TPA: hypothetical protein VFB66_14220, partial [Tepidisphaeraceae bacterium]|nr:hypothetical protein [Tepidisphaeraceae bacterium]
MPPPPRRHRPSAAPARAEALEPRALLAAAGDLDPAFGAGGKVVSNFATASPSRAADVVVQPDNKSILVGPT